MKSYSLLAIGALLLFCRCRPILYSNVSQNVPLLSEKGEFVGQASYSSGEGSWTTEGISLQGAYAITDNFAVISSYHGHSSVGPNDSDEWDGNGRYFEVGGGWYGTSESQKFRYEVFLGLGNSTLNNNSKDNQGNFINSHFFKPFIQPSIGFASQYFDFAFTGRIAHLTFYKTDDYLLLPEEKRAADEFYKEKSGDIVFEPGIMLRGGFENIKLEIKYSYSTLKEPSSEVSNINNEFYSIGLSLRIPPKGSKNP